LRKDLPIIEFDENYLKNLNEKSKDVEDKAANIVFTLNRLVLVEKLSSAIYESLTEKVNRLMEEWKEKTKDYEKIYEQGVEIIKEINQIKSRQELLGFSDVQYSLLLFLEQRFGTEKIGVDQVKDLSDRISKITYRGWFVQPTALKKVEKLIRQFLVKNLRNFGLAQSDLTDVSKQLMERVIEYARQF
jgi:type I restriction enzyme R subunit